MSLNCVSGMKNITNADVRRCVAGRASIFLSGVCEMVRGADIIARYASVFFWVLFN